jgi:hypothetical protein
MSAIAKAAQSIEAEIALTSARLQQLQAALVSLRSLGGAEAAAVAVAVDLPSAVPTEAPRKRGPKKGSTRVRTGLPATGTDFWFGILGGSKKTMNDLVEGALRKLELDETARKVIAARATSWLYPAIKGGTVKAAGKKGDLKAYQKA